METRLQKLDLKRKSTSCPGDGGGMHHTKTWPHIWAAITNRLSMKRRSPRKMAKVRSVSGSIIPNGGVTWLWSGIKADTVQQRSCTSTGPDGLEEQEKVIRMPLRY